MSGGGDAGSIPPPPAAGEGGRDRRPPLLRAVSLTSSLIDPLPDILTCSLCIGLLEDPVNGPCGHVFCRACIKQWALKAPQQSVPCPICRSSLRIDALCPNLVARHYAGQLHVTCTYSWLTEQDAAKEGNNKAGAGQQAEGEPMIERAQHEKAAAPGCPWSGLREDLPAHLAHCAFKPPTPAVMLTPGSAYTRIPHCLIRYRASLDANGGGTAAEVVSNLGLAGTEPWNKWFSGGDAATYVLSLSFALPREVHRYSLQSANDMLERSPTAWELWGTSAADGQRALLHAVSHESFDSTWQQKDYLVAEPTAALYSAVELRVSSTKARGYGCQLGRLSLYRVADAGAAQEPSQKTEWAVSTSDRSGSANFKSSEGTNMFHFNPRPNERQIGNGFWAVVRGTLFLALALALHYRNLFSRTRTPLSTQTPLHSDEHCQPQLGPRGTNRPARGRGPVVLRHHHAPF